MATVEAGVASAVVANPIFQQAGKKAMFEAVAGEDPEANGPITVASISEEERAAMAWWANRIRIAMLMISIAMWVVAFYNFASATNTVSSNFLAIYILFFSTLICCYEVALKRISFYIAQNFGFMYTPVGRSIFLVFVAVMCYELSVFGKIVFGFLIGASAVQLYVNIRHPKFEEYMRSIHFKGVQLLKV